MTSPPAANVCGHDDPGLQPERTVLSWGRTLLSLCGAAALHLRWRPTHGAFVLSLLIVALSLAAGIYATQRMRYRRSVTGIATDEITPDAASVLLTAAACVLLGLLGLVAILFF